METCSVAEAVEVLPLIAGRVCIAIHGSLDVPAYPASHGCIRIPMFASERLPRMVPKGTPVWVYGCKDDKVEEQIVTTEGGAAVSTGSNQ